MQTVYVPVSEDDQFDGSYTSNDGQSLCRLKETEAVLLSKEDADRVKELEAALRSLLDLGRKDFSNPKYDGYFELAVEALNKGK